MMRGWCRTKMGAWSRLLLPVLVVGAGACGKTELHRVVTGSVGAPHTANVRFIMGDEPVPPELHEVALLQALGTGSHANREHVLEGLQANAQALGCTVVAMVKVERGAAVASGTGVCLRP